MFVSCDCCVLSGRGLCVGLITRPEEGIELEYRFLMYPYHHPLHSMRDLAP